MDRAGYVSALEDLVRAGGGTRLSKYLEENSNLPGPRANLTLLAAFGDSLEALAKSDPKAAGEVCSRLAGASPEFLAMCGAAGLGAVWTASPPARPHAVKELKRLSHDGRWRVREAVAIAIQRILAASESFVKELDSWVAGSDWLQARAAVAGVAEPPILRKSPALSEAAMDLHKKAITRFAGAKDRGSEEFKVLRQALGFTLSVVVAEVGDSGFSYLRSLADSGDKDLLWVVKENLKKDRLRKGYPSQTKTLASSL